MSPVLFEVCPKVRRGARSNWKMLSMATLKPNSRATLKKPDSEVLQLYRWMRTARRIDEMERELVARGEAFFQVSGAGHEASAVLAQLLRPDDYLHCHYR